MNESTEIRQPDPADIRRRLENVLDGRGTTASLAAAVGLSQQQFRKIWAGKSGLPEWLVAITELLERVERQNWPPRWHEAIDHRSPLGARERIGVRIADFREEIRMRRVTARQLSEDTWLKLGGIVEDTKTLLVDEGWFDDWERFELDGAARLVQFREMPLLALQRVDKALLIAQMRDQDQMPTWHYDEQVARISEKPRE